MSGVLNLLLAGAASAIKDAYFNLTTLLLNTSSTNGAQNNTFLDSSSSPLTITRNGNVTQGTFTPFSQTGWSNYFGGSSNFTFASADTANAMGTGDWTFEAFVFPTVGGGTPFLLDTLATTSGTTTGIRVRLNASNQVELWNYSSAVLTGGALNLNAWNHVAITKASGTTRIYINGTSSSTYADSGNYTCGASRPMIGSDGYNNGSENSFTGYISNLRTVKGTAVYSGASLTVPTTPLTAITNTSLLICQSNRFLDSSTNAFAITANGTPSVQAFSPFLPTAAYDTAVVGGSGYFDGSGDYLVAPNDTVFDFGSGNFTIEFWVYSNGDNEYMPVEKTINGAFGSWYIQVTSGSLKWNCSSTGSSNDMFNSVNVGTVPTYAWTHIAIVRSGTTFTGYINGVGTSLGTSSSAIYNSSYGITVGAHNGTSSYDLNGHIAGLRLIKGTAAYTSNFTPPTAPPTAITNTSLLLNFTNAGIYDSASKNVLETVGNAQVSTTQAKWGTASLYCPATNGNYFISPPNQQNFIFGTGNFTVEAWIYPTAFTNTAAGLIGYGLDGGYVDWNLEINTSGTVLYIDNDTGRFSSSSNLSTNAWTHIAIVRTNTAVTMYFNGVSVGSYSTINNITGNSSSARLYVGTGAQVPGSRQFIGYIDDPRISKYARYTANFTAPTEAFPIQ